MQALQLLNGKKLKQEVLLPGQMERIAVQNDMMR
jgi:hypothetical protein